MPRVPGHERRMSAAISRIVAVALVAIVGLVTVRSVAAGDSQVWNSQRPLSYGTTDPLPPGAPEGVTASVDGTSVTVRWLAPPDEGSYEVTYYAVTSEPVTQGCLAERSTECVITDVGAGTYTFRVQALNGAGWSPWSAWSTPLVLAQPAPPSLSVVGQRQGFRLSVRVTSTGLAAGSVVTFHTKSAGAPAFVPRRPTVTTGATGEASWSAPWRDRRSVQVYASVGSLRSPTIRIR